jgi:predicted Rossmann fold nucleotide-binding protein DprA/Smf involved in DNA uptake
MAIQIALANKVVVIARAKGSRTMQAVEIAQKIGKPIFFIDKEHSGNLSWL